MKFRLYADNKWRAITDKALFTVNAEMYPDPTVIPSDGWEDSGYTTETGDPVFVPKSKEAETDYNEVTVSKRAEVEKQKVKYEIV